MSGGSHAVEAAEADVRRHREQGLLHAQIVSDQQISNDPVAVKAEVVRMAETYEDLIQVISWFYSEPSRLRPVESRIVEPLAVEATLEQVTVVDEVTRV